MTTGYLIGMHHYNFELIPSFLSEASGAAFGGFLGSCVVWLVREVYVFWRKRPEHAVTYYVAGNRENIYGKLMHERGAELSSKKDIEDRLGSVKDEVIHNGVWEYKLTEDDKHRSKMAFYGPFRYDITEPGTYEASFYYFGRNFDHAKLDNPMLFHLEVLLNESHNEYIKQFDAEGKEIPNSKANTSYRKNLTKGKKFLHYKDFLASAEETNCGKVAKLRFYNSGNGEFEFKAYVPDSPQEAFQNVVEILKKSQIYFYKVEINRLHSIEVAEAI
jgi:hypothetical protein